jgi:hypothetical protein
LEFPGLFGVGGGGVVVAGVSPGTPRPFREESKKFCSTERLLTTRGQKRGRMVTRPFLAYKQTTEGRIEFSEQNEKPHPRWVFWSLTN